MGSQPVSLAGLKALIDNEPEMEVVGQREHPKDAITALPAALTPAALRRDALDVAVIDHGERDRMEPLTALAKEVDGAARFIVLTSSPDAGLLSNVFRQGGRGLVSKHETPTVLINAIRRVHEGDIWLERSSTARLIADLLLAAETKPKKKKKPLLSPRDERIIELVSQGLKNGRIAEEIRVSEATVRNRLTAIFKKLGVAGRLQLVVYACQKGLVKLPVEESRRGSLRLV